MNENANLSIEDATEAIVDRDTLLKVIRAQLVAFLELDSPDDVGPEDAFADLGTDSRQAVEFKILLENLFNCRLRTTVLFEYPTVDRLVDLIHSKIAANEASFSNKETFQAENVSSSTSHDIQTATADAGAVFPLSETQKGLWYISQTLDCETSFNVPLLFRLKEPLDAERFDRALVLVASRHPAIRVRFQVQADSGEVVQEVVSAKSLACCEQLYSSHDQSLHDQLWQKLRTPISLSDRPPLRAYYGSELDGQHYCMILFHHVILDGLSAVPFSAELWQSYGDIGSGDRATLTNQSIDDKFWEYLNWEAQYLASDAAKVDKAFWKNQLEQANQHLELVNSGNPAESQVGCVVRHLTPEFTNALGRLTRKLHAPQSTILLAAFHVLLQRLSGNSVITVTTPVSGRPGGNQGRWKDAFGCFINLMVTSCVLDTSTTFASLVEQVRHEFLEGLEHSQLPLSRQFQAIDTSLIRDRNNPFPISFTYQNIFAAWTSIEEQTAYAEFDFSIYQEIQDDLTLEVYDFGNSLRLNWKFQKSRFALEAVEYWSELFENLLVQVFEQPQKKIGPSFNSQPKAYTGQFAWVSNAAILLAANDKRKQQFTGYATVVDWIDATYCAYRDRIAIVCGMESRTYDWLITESHRIAAEIQSSPNYQPGAIISLNAERSPQTVARVLGILRSGCVYMPVEADAPSERLRMMHEDVAGQTLVDTAYVLFTSGTTGRPKAVPINHSALVNLCAAMIQAYELTSEDVILQFAQLTFDMSVEEIFPALCAGACIVMREDEDLQADRFEALVQRNAISVLNLPPSYHEALQCLGELRRQQLYANVRLVAFGGDKLPLSTLRDVQAAGARIFNAYGPTEACVNCALSELTNASTIHIGTALPGIALIIVDAHRQPVPAYCRGELCILGCGLSSGYLGEVSARDKFVELIDPATGDQSRAYLTGDHAYYDTQGNIHLLGRSDDQLSLRGHRIEPAEVELALETHPLISAAAVAILGERLIGWYTSAQAIDGNELRAHLARRLPAIMIPTALLHVARLPLNERGKLDRSQLKHLPHYAAESHRSDASKQVLFNQRQLEIFDVLESVLCEALELEAIPPTATFWDIGGHSLLAIQVVTLLRQRLEIELTLKEFMRASNLFAFVLQVASRSHGGLCTEETTVATLAAKSRTRSPCRLSTRTSQLSIGQKRLWFLDQLGQSRAYKIPALAEVRGPLRPDRLLTAIECVVARHEILRTNFVLDADGPKCLVRSSSSIPLTVRHFDSSSAAQIWIDEQIEQPFDLANDSLLRVSVASCDSGPSWLLLCMHHIVTDGWSMRVLVDELKHYYTNPASDLPPLELQYQDCTDLLGADYNLQSVTYWRQQLRGLDNSELVTDFAPPPILSDCGDTVSHTVDINLNSQVANYCQRAQITPAAFWLACLAILLRKRRSGDDLCIGVPVAGRTIPEAAKLIGFFVNTVVIRIQQMDARNVLIDDFMQRVATTLYDALEHQTVPIESVIQQLMPERRTDRSPLFQVLFSYATETVETIQLGECTLKPVFPRSDTAKFELTFSINELADGSASLFVEIATDLFTTATANQLAEQLKWVAEQIVQEPAGTISHLTLEKANAPTSNQFLARTESQLLSFDEAFLDQVSRQPEKIALEAANEMVTYRELQLLVAEQTLPWQSGRGPLLVTPQRGIKLIVQCMAAMRSRRPIAFVDPPSCSLDLSGCAWLLPTSGTTSDAKLVAVPSHGMHVHNQAFANLISLTDRDRVAQYATPEFDLFIEEVFPALRCGATVVIVPDECRLDPVALAKWTNTARISVLDIPTAVFHLLTSSDQAISELGDHLRTIIVGGEKLAIDKARALVNCHPSIELWNTCGPTEATIICCAHRFDPQLDVDDVPLGQAFADAELIVVDPDGQPVPVGTAGELVVAGPGVALGYVSSCNKIDNSGFRSHPLVPGQPAYWTGDLVRLDRRQQLHFLGRVDDEVKIRGQRIRLDEVTRAIRLDERVKDAIVLAFDRNGSKELVAAVVTDVDMSELRRSIGVQLPPASRPTTWLRFDELPVNPRGKIDRKMILASARDVTIGDAQAHAATDEMTARVLQHWRSVLRTDQLGVDDDFFLVGGHSLLAVELIQRLNREFSAQLTVLDAFRYPTASAQSARLKENSRAELKAALVKTPLVKLFPSNRADGRVIVILPGLPGIGEFYFPLAKTLTEVSSVAVLSMPGAAIGEPARSLQKCAQIWLDQLQSVLSEHQIKQCTFVAHSYSASILVELLRNHSVDLPPTKRVMILDAWPHQQQSLHGLGREYWEKLHEQPQFEFAKPLMDCALAAASLVPGKLFGLEVDLIIAQSSQAQLDQTHWEPWFDNIRMRVVPGNHLSIVQHPDSQAWISILNSALGT